PQNLDSFIFPGLYHVSALGNDGLLVLHFRKDTIKISRPFVSVLEANGSAMA
ncbi:hypothetical protein C8Q76DRAFT_590404, partial [Earliella scabrosa]